MIERIPESGLSDTADRGGTRVNVHGADGERNGHFTYEDAQRWGDEDYNGNGGGGAGRGEAVLLTAGGDWVLEHWTRWQGETSRWAWITDTEAREWLLSHNEDDAVREYFGEIPPEDHPGRGRPEVGGRITVSVGEERLQRVDECAERRGVKRAEAIRDLLDRGLAASA